MTTPIVQVDPVLRSIVRLAAGATGLLRVVDRAVSLDAPLLAAAERRRAAAAPDDVISAVRSMYKAVGIDPTRTRPSSEALLRRVRRGDAFPRVNGLVDVVNWTSLETQLPFGVYDRAQIRGAVVLRLGHDGEAYAGIRKDTVHVAGRLTLADDDGAFGNPTSDSARTMVTPGTTDALVVVFAPATIDPALAERALALALQRADAYCAPSGPHGP